MNCNQYQEWVSAEIDGMLDEPQARLLREHLADCPACRQVKADLERTVALLRTLPEAEPPPDLLETVHQKLAAAPTTRQLIWQMLALPQTRVAMAAAVLMIVAIYSYWPQATRDIQAAGKSKDPGAVGKELQSKPAKLAPASAVDGSAGGYGGGQDKSAQAEVHDMAEAVANKPRAALDQERAGAGSQRQVAEMNTELAKASAVPAALSATAPARKTGAKLLVLTADSAAVLRTLAPYRQEPKQDQSKNEIALMASPLDADQQMPRGQPAPGQRQAVAEEQARGSERQMQKAKQQSAAEQEPGARSVRRSRGEELQAAETLLTIWVPSGEYPALIEKVRALGEITDDVPPADKAQLGTADASSAFNQPAEVIAVQIRIRQR